MRFFKILVLSIFLSAWANVIGQTHHVFGNAKWIGGNDDDMTLYSPYLTVFRLSCDIDGDGWIKFGGADDRFTESFLNQWHIQCHPDSIYISVESDSKNGFIKIKASPEISAKNAKLIEAPMLKDGAKHRLELAVAYGTTDVIIDDKKIGTVNLNPWRGSIDESLWLSVDYIAYPSIGKVSHSENVSDVVLRNYRSPGNVIERENQNHNAESVFVDRSPLQLLTTFVNHGEVDRGTLAITARGIYDAYLNGTLINSDAYLCPGFTQYDRTHLYQVYDVTDMLRQGNNKLGVVLSEGWWSGASTYSAQNWNYTANSI